WMATPPSGRSLRPMLRRKSIDKHLVLARSANVSALALQAVDVLAMLIVGSIFCPVLGCNPAGHFVALLPIDRGERPTLVEIRQSARPGGHLSKVFCPPFLRRKCKTAQSLEPELASIVEALLKSS